MLPELHWTTLLLKAWCLDKTTSERKKCAHVNHEKRKVFLGIFWLEFWLCWGMCWRWAVKCVTFGCVWVEISNLFQVWTFQSPQVLRALYKFPIAFQDIFSKTKKNQFQRKSFIKTTIFHLFFLENSSTENEHVKSLLSFEKKEVETLLFECVT